VYFFIIKKIKKLYIYIEREREKRTIKGGDVVGAHIYIYIYIYIGKHTGVSVYFQLLLWKLEREKNPWWEGCIDILPFTDAKIIIKLFEGIYVFL